MKYDDIQKSLLNKPIVRKLTQKYVPFIVDVQKFDYICIDNKTNIH